MYRSRILIADDHNLVAELCKNLLQPEFDVVGIATDGRRLVRMASQHRPDVIIVDIAMPLLNGLDAANQVKQRLPAVKVIFLTMNPDPEIAVEALRRNASGYVLKTSAASELLLCVHEVLKGTTYISSRISKQDIDALRLEGKKLIEEANRLTERQKEVLQLLAEGKSMKEVGSELQMTTRTVAFHKYRIMQLLGARTSADLVKYAVRHHLTAA
jgi:DNA-binding NarL/FixJ family response regulator